MSVHNFPDEVEQIEEALGRSLEEDLYTVLAENSHEQNIRLILNQMEMEQKGEIVKDFVDRIPHPNPLLKHESATSSPPVPDKSGQAPKGEGIRDVQLVIVTDPKQMDKVKVREFLLLKGVQPDFVYSSSLRIVYERMQEDRTFSFRNFVSKNRSWLKKGDYSNWIFNENKRWSDLVGQILSNFCIKNGIQLLELDLKASFLTKTAA